MNVNDLIHCWTLKKSDNMNHDPDYPHEVTQALIYAIPDNPYNPCPCGCGKKWRFVMRDGEAEEHAKRFCDNYLKNIKNK